jgi:hypothetical protein
MFLRLRPSACRSGACRKAHSGTGLDVYLCGCILERTLGAKEEGRMRYEVPNLRLIPQDNDLACWYASAQMVIQWRRETRKMTEARLLDPSEEPQSIRMHANRDAIPWAQIRRFAQDLGLVPLPLMSPTTQALLDWVRRYGPIWADGMKYVAQGGRIVSYGHVVVIGGVGTNPDELLVLDPEHGGSRTWRPMGHLASMLSDGANTNRNAFLLRLP